MNSRTLCLSLIAFAILPFFTTNHAWTLERELGQSKEELELKYDVDATVHDSGRVTVDLSITDLGKLEPIDAVRLAIPSDDGTGFFDLSLNVETRDVEGKKTARIHLSRKLADRAQIQLVTHISPETGKHTPRTWYYHSIPLREYIEAE